MGAIGTGDIIRRKLTEALAPDHLAIVDESDQHAGHAGARGGGGHFAVTIVSQVFAGVPTLQRHRLVYRALAAEMNREIHALALTALTPEEWRAA